MKRHLLDQSTLVQIVIDGFLSTARQGVRNADPLQKDRTVNQDLPHVKAEASRAF